MSGDPANRLGRDAAKVAPRTASGNVLDVANIEVIYNHVILVLKGVSLAVPEGAIVALPTDVGPGSLFYRTDLLTQAGLKEGDRILYQKYTGQEITVDKTEYIVIRFQDVLARLEEDAAPAGGRARGSAA